MSVDVGRRGEGESRSWVFNRLGGVHESRDSFKSSSLPLQQRHQQQRPQKVATPQTRVCNYWKAGRCLRRPCPYLHNSDTTSSGSSHPLALLPISNTPSTTVSTAPIHDDNKVCRYWLADRNSCLYGDNCRFLHKRFHCDALTMLAHLPGHHKAITGVALPQASAKLFSASKDDSLRAWDCESGQSAGVLTLGAETGSLIAKGPWLFVGIPNAVRAWNLQTNTDFTLSGPVGQVYALVCTDTGMLFAGTQEGTIFVWRFNEATSCFDPLDALKSHTLGVVTLVVGAANSTLYSGSMDSTIRVWNLDTLQCTQTLTEHTSVVMSLLCWDQFLLSSSLDGTVKVWAFSQNHTLEVVYSRAEQHGVLRLCGTHDAESKPVLLCSCNNNVVYIYDLPSFNERGRIFSKEEVRAMEAGPEGLFFTGDATGDLRVWKWSQTAAA